MTKLVDISGELEVTLQAEKSSNIKRLHKLIYRNAGGIKNRQRIREL